MSELRNPQTTPQRAPGLRAVRTFESRGFDGNAGFEHCARIKFLAALLWEELDNISVPPDNSEAGRLVALAKTELESSVMWANKALSRNHDGSSQIGSPS